MEETEGNFLIEAIGCEMVISQECWDRWQHEMVRQAMEYLPKDEEGVIENDESSFEALCVMINLMEALRREKNRDITTFDVKKLKSMWDACFFAARIASEARLIPGLVKKGLARCGSPDSEDK